MKKVLVLAVLLAIVFASVALAEVPKKISFQGYVSSLSGNPIQGTHEFTFRIYATQSGGDPLWNDTDTLELDNGQFHAYLGANTPLAVEIFTGSVLWLETAIDGSALPTRQSLASVAYSFRAQNADTANVALSVSNPADNCFWQTDSTNVWRTSGNVGIGTSTPAYPLDVYGNVRVGSRAQNNVAFLIEGPNSPTDPNSAQDLRFSFEAAGSAGIRAYRWAGWDTYLQFLTNDYNQGSDTPQPRMTITGSGLVGIGTANPGCMLDIQTPDNLNNGLRLAAGQYELFSISNGGIVLRPYPSDWASPFLIQNYGRGGVARTQIVSTSSMGQNGRPSLDYPDLALQPNGGKVGIGTANPTATLHVVGDLCVTGQKNAIVPTSQGMTKVYSEESAEVWFSDYGEGQLEHGQAVVELDPLFLEAVTIDNNSPLKVFISLEDNCKGVYYKPGIKGFDVVELMDGKSNAHFSYRVVAKRKGMENNRLELVKQ
jgi:hypothetical protein